MSGWDNLEGKNKRTGARLVENAKLRQPVPHLGLDHVFRSATPECGNDRLDSTLASSISRILVYRAAPRVDSCARGCRGHFQASQRAN
eukprot:5487768-Prymnesium_polylepis.1